MTRKKITFVLGAAALATSTLSAAGVGSAQALEPGQVVVWLALGSGHLYNGAFDSCTGNFTATGTTVGYPETVSGNVKNGVLVFNSMYTGDVNDGTGIYNPYTYSVSATVNSLTHEFGGSYTVVKTPVPVGASVTEGPVAFTGVGTSWFETADGTTPCDTPAPPVMSGTHGEYVSGATKAGVTGKALADIAKDKTKVGPYKG